jgi:hypothetical protein
MEIFAFYLLNIHKKCKLKYLISNTLFIVLFLVDLDKNGWTFALNDSHIS